MDDVHLILLIGNLLGEDARRTGMGNVEGSGCDTGTLGHWGIGETEAVLMGRVLWSAVCYIHNVVPEGYLLTVEGASMFIFMRVRYMYSRCDMGRQGGTKPFLCLSFMRLMKLWHAHAST